MDISLTAHGFAEPAPGRLAVVRPTHSGKNRGWLLISYLLLIKTLEINKFGDSDGTARTTSLKAYVDGTGR